MAINPELAKKQNLSKESIEYIETLHKVRRSIFQEMEGLNPDSNLEQILSLGEEITKLEFLLQDTWKFPLNKTKHKFWELPHCSCPKMDNEDMWGSKYMIYTEECIFHGNSKKF